MQKKEEEEGPGWMPPWGATVRSARWAWRIQCTVLYVTWSHRALHRVNPHSEALRP
jgi:hypothetical protein